MELLGKKNRTLELLTVWIKHQLLKIKIWAFTDSPLRCTYFHNVLVSTKIFLSKEKKGDLNFKSTILPSDLGLKSSLKKT